MVILDGLDESTEADPDQWRALMGDLPAGTRVLRFADGDVWFFSANGRLSKQVDRHGNEVDFTYDAVHSRLSTISASGGRFIRLSWDNAGRVTTATDDASRSVGYEYDIAGNLVGVRGVDGQTTTYAHEDMFDHMLTAVYAPEKTKPFVRNTYDVLDRVITQSDGYDSTAIRSEYRGGIGEIGVENLKQFVADGGTLVTMGNACDLAIERLPIPVRNLKKGLTRDQHFAPGAILRLEVDTQHPVGYGMEANTYGFYINSPFFSLVEGFASQKTSVVARYPNTDVVASGWLKGEELMTGRAAVVSVDMNPGRIVLFGLRPQHRAQTPGTFPFLFNALYWSTAAPR